jgi:glycerol-3-phosphate dehydrogenase (NAD(P)+)
MAKIVILGAGMMGSAFSVPLADNGHAVHLVGTHLDANIVDSLRQNRFHPRLNVHLPETVQPHAHDQLGEALRGADLAILGVNSAGLDWAAEKLSPVLPLHAPVVMLTKGLRGEGDKLNILPNVLRARLPSDYVGPICTIRGPSIAGELAVRRHTSVVLTCPDQSVFNSLAGCLRTSYYHVWPNTDLVGVEVCAALKNLFSLAVGVVSGLLEGSPEVENRLGMHNLSAALFAEALCEITYMVTMMGGHQRSIWTLPGAGDLYVTCQGGRNIRMGRWLGLGVPYSEAKARYMSEETLEGADTAFAIGPAINAMTQQGALDPNALPLMRAIIDVVCQDGPLYIPWDRFFGSEFPPR